MFSSFEHLFPVYGTPLPVDKVIQTLARTEQSSKILASSNTKIERAKLLFNEHVDMDVIAGQLSHPKRDGKTPKMFLHGVYEECRRDRKRIVLPEAFDPRVLRAAAEVTNKGGYDVWNMKYEALVDRRSSPVARRASLSLALLSSFSRPRRRPAPRQQRPGAGGRGEVQRRH